MAPAARALGTARGFLALLRYGLRPTDFIVRLLHAQACGIAVKHRQHLSCLHPVSNLDDEADDPPRQAPQLAAACGPRRAR
jgi:hypothetical protein